MQTHCFSGGYGRRRREAGFTLIELMIVVAMMTVVTALAVRVMSRASRGERAPAFARSVLAMVHHARETAIVNSKPTKILIYAGTGYSTIESYVQQTASDGTTSWVKLDGASPTAHGIDVCDAMAGRQTGSWPTTNFNCPTTATSTSPIVLYFSKSLCTATSGTSNVFNCKDGSNTTSGSTIFLQTHDAAKQYRIPIWGLTGMPALVDR